MTCLRYRIVLFKVITFVCLHTKPSLFMFSVAKQDTSESDLRCVYNTNISLLHFNLLLLCLIVKSTSTSNILQVYVSH